MPFHKLPCVEAEPPVRLLLAFTALLLLFADFPLTRGAERSFVTAFFKALPCCIDLSKSPRSAVPPPLDLVGDLKAGGLGGPPEGGGGGGLEITDLFDKLGKLYAYKCQNI